MRARDLWRSALFVVVVVVVALNLARVVVPASIFCKSNQVLKN